jgi:hypothetical protein
VTALLGDIAAAEATVPEGPSPVSEPQPFDPCKAPEARPVVFVLPYRRPMALESFEVPPGDPVEQNQLPPLRLACVRVKPPVDLLLGLSLLFEQSWAVVGIFLGDLSSTMSLAPGERLTLEFQSSQRRLLDQTTVDSAEELTSLESTTADKDVLNAARSSTRTEGWHVDGSGSVSLGSIASLGVAGGAQGSVQDVAQGSIQHVTEATRKSAHSLKTLHKIEVRGVTETFIQNRMTRTIKNPFPDRTLSLNVFQLVRHYAIETRLAEIRLLLTVRFDGLDFDAGFVIANTDFLQETLLDTAFIDEFPLAFAGAKPLPAAVVRANEAAQLALELLFDEPNIFDILPFVNQRTNASVDPNLPATSFNEAINIRPGQPPGEIIDPLSGRIASSGLDESLQKNLGVIFTILNFFFAAYQKLKRDPDPQRLPNHALALATALKNGLKQKWEAFITITETTNNSAQLRDALDPLDFTEIFRRLSGFLAMVEQMVAPSAPEPAASPSEGAAPAAGTIGAAAGGSESAREDQRFALQRLLAHLNCNSHFYTQRYLAHIARKTNNQAIVDFVEEVIDRAEGLNDQDRSNIRTLFDIQAAFVDRQQILVPSIRALTEDEVGRFIASSRGEHVSPFHFGDIVPTVEPELELPTDGIHLEVAEGLCKLTGLPQGGQQEVQLSVQGAQLKVETS